ncbi:MAG: hypothetical protein HYV92_12095 [Candidatus Rokubacteria bacterium]|nr:hypothetical protein [Candidatus Rokubacteria bacterium]MBI2544274.1 hypothetical protein [Candidatus Rokubacteria bacterium]MBI2555123.1 hypothetical protein [Candidatus Rokubacteria bacterium]
MTTNLNELPGDLPVPVDVEAGRLVRVWYPVFPPDKNAQTVLAWLRERRAQG